MTSKSLLYNARIYTVAGPLVVDSMALRDDRVEAIGHSLHLEGEFRSYSRVNLNHKTVVPGFVDAHTHFFFFALSLGRVNLHELESLDACVKRIQKFARGLATGEWVVGEGYTPNRFRRIEPDRYLLDDVTGGRPAFVFSKDQHSAWVNSLALKMAGISPATPDPKGGRIERFADGIPSGILREAPAYQKVLNCIPDPPEKEINRRWALALEHAHKKGVTGVHSFDGPRGFTFMSGLAEKNRLGLRINYYAPARLLSTLRETGAGYGAGTDYFRLAGVKIFADGSLGSQTALCFNRYLGSKDNYGIEVTTVPEMRRLARSASRLGLPCAIHAIGDKAVANVLDALEGAPSLSARARHRIEHLQLVRRKDLLRLKRLGVVASAQPSHCPSDIGLVRSYWGARGADAYIFRTIIDKHIPMAFGSDAPIEPLDPIAGIAAAVRRAQPGSRDVFRPEQRITASEALFRFTVGPAIACGQEHCRGRLLPGYPADFVVLSEDITKVPPTRIYDVRVLATVLAGHVKYCHSSISRAGLLQTCQ
ncbi:MAG TPA: amidohydrolase [Candidatus Deferrimicrobium sp.]|nr:amidohydrolase [Candidatus Deferrimicrobium sp.]